MISLHVPNACLLKLVSLHAVSEKVTSATAVMSDAVPEIRPSQGGAQILISMKSDSLCLPNNHFINVHSCHSWVRWYCRHPCSQNKKASKDKTGTWRHRGAADCMCMEKGSLFGPFRLNFLLLTMGIFVFVVRIK